MDWLGRWKDGFIGWHKQSVNKRLIKYLDNLNLSKNSTIFVPLCGKTLDMIYLLEKGFKIIGVELSELAISDFFNENNLEFEKIEMKDFICYKNENITIYCGDFFKLTSSMLKDVNAIYDRASLIALDQNMRKEYSNHLFGIIPRKTSWLLLTMNYSQDKKDGPPFAVSEDEVKSLFKAQWNYSLLERIEDLDNEPKFQELGLDFLEKAVYLLRKD